MFFGAHLCFLFHLLLCVCTASSALLFMPCMLYRGPPLTSCCHWARSPSRSLSPLSLSTQVMEALGWVTFPFTYLYALYTEAVYQWVRTLYLHSPNFHYFGGWEGKTLEDICAQKTGGKSDHWLRNMDECHDIITKAVHGATVLVHSVIMATLILVFLRWILTPKAVPQVVNHFTAPASAPAPVAVVPAPRSRANTPDPVKSAKAKSAYIIGQERKQKVIVYEHYLQMLFHMATSEPETPLGTFLRRAPLPALLPPVPQTQAPQALQAPLVQELLEDGEE